MEHPTRQLSTPVSIPLPTRRADVTPRDDGQRRLIRGFLAALTLSLLAGCSGIEKAVVVPPATPETATEPQGTAPPETLDPPVVTPADPPAETAPLDPTTAPLDATIPAEAAIRRGKLDNGLTYYIRRHGKPEGRAELRLVIDAGSVLEKDDEQGLAHFIEHMAFNGTRNFEKQELIDYLELIGTRFGADLNAYTGFDETVYQLKVPTDDPEIVATAFQILEDWAHGITFDPAEVDKERGVIVEEWRLGRGAGARLRDRQLPVLLHGSRYAERLPIGTLEVLENAPAERLRAFYQRWYRPQLMAVVAVGDFDPEAIEATLRKQFESIENPDQPTPRPVYELPEHEKTLFSLATDPELTGTSVAVHYKHPIRSQGTFGDYRRGLVEGLYIGMLNNRLGELAQQAEPPFLFAGAGLGDTVRSATFFSQQARVRDGEVESGLEALLREIERVDRHGFTASELDRAKVNLARAYEQAYRERDKLQSGTLAAEYVRNFLEGEALPGIEVELALVSRFLSTIGLDEVDRLARAWIRDESRVILLSAPETADQALPSEEDLLAVFETVRTSELEPYVDRTRDEPLLAEVPEPSPVVEETVIEELEITEWRLKNGVRVVLKPTDFQNDQILLTAWSPGGHSLVSDADHTTAVFATSILSESGLGPFDRIELGKALAGKVASAQTFISELQEGVTGFASPQDLETMFQLLYLGFTSPRLDLEAHQSLMSRLRILIANRGQNPGTVFQDQLNLLLGQEHPRRRPISEELLAEVDPKRALEIYRERFADASELTVVMVGNFDPATLRPLVETYLGGLPTTGRHETWRDIGVEAPTGPHELRVHRGLEPKSQVRLIYHGDAPWSREGVHEINTLTQVLEIRLREVLREDLGATYGVSVGASLGREPRERYSLSIAFGCDPQEVDALVEVVRHELAAVMAEGIDPNQLVKVKESQRRERETDLRENAFWLRALELYYDWGVDPRVLLEYDALVDSVSPESLQAASRRYFDTENQILAVLDPAEDP